MSQLAPSLIVCVLQVTTLAILACGLEWLLRRRSPVIRSTVTLSALLVILGLSMMAASPWPNWTRNWWQPATAPSLAESTADGTHSELPAHDPPSSGPKAVDLESVWAAAWQGFHRSLTTPGEISEPDSSAIATISTTAVIVWVLVAGATVGLIRLIGGWLAVGRMRARSRRVTDPSLTEELDLIQATLHCVKAVELLESRQLTTAATVGWRKPVILLPADWRDWTLTERRAVLAHEVAHIQHRDYAAWIAAQLSVVLHFYHPLVHWLASRLRTDQELAADAAAAPLVGGRQTYLETLAALALRNSERRLSWPVSAFLPTRHTFLRRLEMLRDPQQLTANSTAKIRWLSVTGMLLAGLAIAGIRGPATSAATIAADEPLPSGQTQGVDKRNATPPVAKSGQNLSLAFVPRDAVGVIGLRTTTLVKDEQLKPLFKALVGDGDFVTAVGLAPEQVESVTCIFQMNIDSQGPVRSVETNVIVRTLEEGPARQLREKLASNPRVSEFDGQKIWVSQEGPFAIAMPDARTVVLAMSEGALRRLLIAGPNSTSSAAIASAWNAVSLNDVAMVLDVSRVASQMPPREALGPLASLAPLWTKSRTVSMGLRWSDQLVLQAIADTANSQDAADVEKTLKAASTLVRNQLAFLRTQASQLEATRSAFTLRSIDIIDQMLESARIGVEGDQVRLDAEAPKAGVAHLALAMVPATKDARLAARMAQDKNNMKQLLLAMHNYHDTFGHFPPAVIRDKAGKALYSWRVALLPFLDQAPLYDKLRRDEPWDSAHNKPLLEKVPATFRSPLDSKDSNNASYYAFTGDHTAFSNPEGNKMSEFFDGTSNTALIVEAKRDIHWAAPDDIPFDADQPLPEIGGRYPDVFLVGLADGSVTEIPASIKPENLKRLIMRDDGQPIDWDNL